MKNRMARRSGGVFLAIAGAFALAFGSPLAAQAATVPLDVVNGSTLGPESVADGGALEVSGSGYRPNTSTNVAICDITFDPSTGTGCDNTFGNYVATSAHDTTVSGSNVTVVTDANGEFTVSLRASETFQRWNGRTGTTGATITCNGATGGTQDCAVQAVQYPPPGIALGTTTLDFAP